MSAESRDEILKRSTNGTGDVKSPINATIPSGDQSVWADVSSLLKLTCNVACYWETVSNDILVKCERLCSRVFKERLCGNSIVRFSFSDLRDGELIHGENFNLFAAMSALEIMDPKMDSGIVSTYYSVDEAIEKGAAPIPLSFSRTVDILHTIDIMDHLLACEATWHKGHSLSQTVFSCIYLLRPERTSSHALLHSYCRVVRATCNAVVGAVSDTRTNEEEDLFIMAYGLPLKVDGDEKCLSMLQAVEETISRQLRACKVPLSKRRDVEDMEPLQDNPELEEGFCRAILCRLRFRKHFHHVLMSMRRSQVKGLELAGKHITSCLSELESMLKLGGFMQSNNTKQTVTDSFECDTTASGCRPIGFDPTLNARCSAPTPPRSIKMLSWKKAVEYFQKLLKDLQIVCSLTLEPSLDGILRFLVKFQKLHPDLVARAYLQLLLVQDGKLLGLDSIFAVIGKAALLPEVAKNHELQKNEAIMQLGQLLVNLLRILCSNTAWQRRKLGKILQDWRIIYVQLEMAFRKELGDTVRNSNHESLDIKSCNHILIWVEEQTYWIALCFLTLGFDLELYSPPEYCMVYWYIYIILIKLAEKTHIKTMASSDNGRRKGRKKRDSMKGVSKDYQMQPMVLLLQCQIYLAEGLTMMLAALRNEYNIFQNLGPFNSEHERFLQHFELLLKACLPDHVSYYSYKETTNRARLSVLAMSNCFKDAQRIAKDLKATFSNDPDKLTQIRGIEQVAEHNIVALNLICRLGTLDPSLKIYFEFSHHPYFATAVVKRS